MAILNSDGGVVNQASSDPLAGKSPLIVTPGMTDEEKWALEERIDELVGDQVSISYDPNDWNGEDEHKRGHMWYALARLHDTVYEFYLDDREHEGDLVENLAQALDDYGRQFLNLASELRRGPAGEKVTLYRAVLINEDGSRKVCMCATTEPGPRGFVDTINQTGGNAVLEVVEASIVSLVGRIELEAPTSPADAR